MSNFFRGSTPDAIVYPPSSISIIERVDDIFGQVPSATNGYIADSSTGLLTPPSITYTSSATISINNTPTSFNIQQTMQRTSTVTATSQVVRPSNSQHILPSNFEQLVADATAASEILTIRNYNMQTAGNKRPKPQRKKPGKKPTIVSSKLYHLPGGSVKPCFTKGDDAVVMTHFNAGYGFAKQCYNSTTKKIKKMAINLSLNERQFNSYIKEIFPKIGDTFKFFTMSYGGIYIIKDIKTPLDLKSLNYSGTVVIANSNELPPYVTLQNDNMETISSANANTSTVTSHLTVIIPTIVSSNNLVSTVSRPSSTFTSTNRISRPSSTTQSNLPARSIMITSSNRVSRPSSTSTNRISRPSSTTQSNLPARSIMITSSNRVSHPLSTFTNRISRPSPTIQSNPRASTTRVTTSSQVLPVFRRSAPFTINNRLTMPAVPIQSIVIPTQPILQPTTIPSILSGIPRFPTPSALLRSLPRNSGSRNQLSHTRNNTQILPPAVTTLPLIVTTSPPVITTLPIPVTISTPTTTMSLPSIISSQVFRSVSPPLIRIPLRSVSTNLISTSTPTVTTLTPTITVTPTLSTALPSVSSTPPLVIASTPLRTSSPPTITTSPPLNTVSSPTSLSLPPADLNFIYDFEPDVNSEEESNDRPITLTERQISMLISNFHRKRRSILSKIQNVELILIHRSRLIESAIEYYQKTDITKCKLAVKFFKENGVDLEGLTREFFSSFWAAFLSKYGAGEEQINLLLTPNNILSSKELEAVGRILYHGYLLCGYLPIQLNNASLFYLIYGKIPSDKLLTASFLSTLSEYDKMTIKSSHFDEVKKVKLMSTFGQFDSTVVPDINNISKSMEQIGYYAGIVKPFFFLSAVRNSFQKVADEDMDKHFEEEQFAAYLFDLRPTGAKIIERLTPIHHSDPYLIAQEEKVFEFVKNFLSMLSPDDAGLFSKYVTGNELNLNDMLLDFNGEDNPSLMHPTASTCSQTLYVSRYFANQSQFDKYMKEVLEAKESWLFLII